MKRIIEQVRQVDEVAAKWLEEEVQYEPSFAKNAKYLNGLFMWVTSPQGHDFWSKIADEINNGRRP